MPRFRALQHHPPRVWAAIAGAGGAGSLLRYAVTAEGGWLAIVVVNVAGCAVLGALVARGRATPALATGFCGGLTTFSGVAVQADAALRDVGPGLLRAGGDPTLSGAGAALLVLALNAALGLVAFLAARAAASGGSPTPSATTVAQELEG